VANPNPFGRRKVGVLNKMSSARVERAAHRLSADGSAYPQTALARSDASFSQ